MGRGRPCGKGAGRSPAARGRTAYATTANQQGPGEGCGCSRTARAAAARGRGPGEGCRDLPVGCDQRGEGARHHEAVDVHLDSSSSIVVGAVVHHAAPRAQATRRGGQHPAARSSELRGATKVVEDA
eukprot:scaffold40047_cov63-Phaeocystis_antarctica.AAC.5